MVDPLRLLVRRIWPRRHMANTCDLSGIASAGEPTASRLANQTPKLRIRGKSNGEKSLANPWHIRGVYMLVTPWQHVLARPRKNSANMSEVHGGKHMPFNVLMTNARPIRILGAFSPSHGHFSQLVSLSLSLASLARFGPSAPSCTHRIRPLGSRLCRLAR